MTSMARCVPLGRRWARCRERHAFDVLHHDVGQRPAGSRPRPCVHRHDRGWSTPQRSGPPCGSAGRSSVAARSARNTLTHVAVFVAGRRGQCDLPTCHQTEDVTGVRSGRRQVLRVVIAPGLLGRSVVVSTAPMAQDQSTPEPASPRTRVARSTMVVLVFVIVARRLVVLAILASARSGSPMTRPARRARGRPQQRHADRGRRCDAAARRAVAARTVEVGRGRLPLP